MIALLLVALAGQTVERTIDLQALQMGPFDNLTPVETDGDFTTPEWLLYRSAEGTFTVIAERPHAICFGTPFKTGTAGAFIPPPETVRVGLVHKLKVRNNQTQKLDVVSLDTPPCPAP